jgi:predicted CoA-substrate-specific enzyme activase
MSKKIFLGIDIGSRTAKGVLLKDEQLYTAIQPTGLYMQETAEEIYKSLKESARLNGAKVDYAVFTGYGRVAVSFNDAPSKIVTEISCHAMGAHFLNPSTGTVIDIGGQDSKVIKVDRSTGKVLDFAINDKCAAGTGKFLETTSLLLGLGIEEIGEVALDSTKPSQISSQCIVFAESEIISLRAKGEKREDIAAGIHFAVARRIDNLLSRIGKDEDVLFTGGVSRNKGAEAALEETLRVKFSHVDLDTIYAGAVGAALFAKNYGLQQGGGI